MTENADLKERNTGEYFLGVDIGGTKSHALIANRDGQAVGFAVSGPGNYEGVGTEGFRTVTATITENALEMTGVRRDQVAGAGFGIAGYDWPSERALMMRAIASLGLSCPVEAVNDTIIGLLAGAQNGWGVALVAGTGENCWGWGQDRETGRVTGNGYLMGEYGGSWALAMRAVHAVSRAWSQRGPQTALTQALCEQTGATSVDDLLEGLVLGRYKFGAESAPVVFQVAAGGDTVALEVIRWAAHSLADLALGVIRQLGFEELGFGLVLIGSLFDGGPLLQDPLEKAVHAVAGGARFIRLTAPPVVGGVLLGMEQAGIDTYKTRTRLIETTNMLLEG